MMLYPRLRAIFLGGSLLLATALPVMPAVGEHPGAPPQSDSSAPGAPATPNTGQGDVPPPQIPKDPVAQCLQDNMNHVRTVQGLAPLPEVAPLLHIAQTHSNLMASQQVLHHSTDEILAFLPAGWKTYGENVVHGKDCRQMFDAFMGSDSHREAILRPDFNFSGNAVASGADGWIYATMVFAHLPVVPAAPPVAPPGGPAQAGTPAAGATPVLPPPAPAADPAAVPLSPPGPLAVPPPPTINLGIPPQAQTSPSAAVSEDAPAVLGSVFLEAYAGAAKQAAARKVPAERPFIFDLADQADAVFRRQEAPQIVFDLESGSGRPAPRPSGMA